MIAFIVIAACMVYLTIGTVYASRQAVDCYRRSRDAAQEQWHSPANISRYTRSGFHGAMGRRIFFWPAMVIVATAMQRPLDRAREQAQQLRSEADQYDALIASCEDPTDRDLMRKGQAALRERAAEVDL